MSSHRRSEPAGVHGLCRVSPGRSLGSDSKDALTREFQHTPARGGCSGGHAVSSCSRGPQSQGPTIIQELRLGKALRVQKKMDWFAARKTSRCQHRFPLLQARQPLALQTRAHPGWTRSDEHASRCQPTNKGCTREAAALRVMSALSVSGS